MDTADFWQLSLGSFWAEIERHFKTERVAEAAFQLRLELPELKRYFPVPATLN